MVRGLFFLVRGFSFVVFFGCSLFVVRCSLVRGSLFFVRPFDRLRVNVLGFLVVGDWLLVVRGLLFVVYRSLLLVLCC